MAQSVQFPGYGLDDRGIGTILGRGKKFHSSMRLDRFWGTYNRYPGQPSLGQSSQDVNLTTPVLGMRAAIFSLPHASLWRGAD